MLTALILSVAITVPQEASAVECMTIASNVGLEVDYDIIPEHPGRERIAALIDPSTGEILAAFVEEEWILAQMGNLDGYSLDNPNGSMVPVRYEWPPNSGEWHDGNPCLKPCRWGMCECWLILIPHTTGPQVVQMEDSIKSQLPPEAECLTIYHAEDEPVLFYEDDTPVMMGDSYVDITATLSKEGDGWIGFIYDMVELEEFLSRPKPFRGMEDLNAIAVKCKHPWIPFYTFTCCITDVCKAGQWKCDCFVAF